MPDLVIPAEADHCVHCGAVLYNPPTCCEEAKTEYRQFLEEFFDADVYDDYGYGEYPNDGHDEGVID